jgi:ParB family transcriptional regulator, chromosome partitioning protein
MAKPALGRGLGALLKGQHSSQSHPSAPTLPNPKSQQHTASTKPANAPEGQLHKAPIQQIVPSSLQPRKDFPKASLQELADSIRQKGILQPLVVRPVGEQYELIAGERRWRAAQLLGLTEIPIVVRKADDTTVLELMLVENLQREGLNPIEEAHGYQQLISQFRLRQEDIASRVGKSRAAVANALRLLKLPEDTQKSLRDGALTVGHAKAILGLASADLQRKIALRVVKKQLSVRQTEELVARSQHSSKQSMRNQLPADKPSSLNARITEVENQLQRHFGTKVNLRYQRGKGSIEIKYVDDDDFHRILQIIGVSTD